MIRRLLELTGACMVLAASPGYATLATSKHNLTVTGPGTIKAVSEGRMCVFCHTPHNASPSTPLWNRATPGTSYTPYSSSTAKGNAGQPTRGSLLCLSCHDGTIALGSVLSSKTAITMAGGVTKLPSTSPSMLGTDLSGDHPVSIHYSTTYNARGAVLGQLAAPATLTAKVRLDSTGQMQCTSCHDPHDDTNAMFLVMPNQASALCISCHLMNNWSQGSHAQSAKTWNGVGPNPWTHTTGTTVAANACESCHRPHSAPFKKWLQNAATEEGNCYPCHNGNVAAKNVQTEFSKAYLHNVALTTGAHDAAEAALVNNRHVECQDCHNPHASNASAGTLPGSLIGVKGIDITGVPVNPAQFEYQICFRCHADSGGTMTTQHTARQIAQINTRLEFATSNPSFHPVAGPGVNTNVPSLIAPWRIASVMKCGDCHNNNTGPGAGGTEANGPHASIYPTLLERQYVTIDNTPESPANYALCYKCHNRTRFITSTDTPSPFGTDVGHQKHVVEMRSPCNVCHDPHGVSSTQGNPANNSKLINFDISVVRPINGRLQFISTSTNHGTCYLICHGEPHNPRSY